MSQKSTNSSGKVKKVSFAEGTIMPRQDNIALSISKHTYSKELGYTQYFIQLMYRETEWSVFKRYRDFEELHNTLLSEYFESGIELPKLPKKRWFEKQRWLNKFDESYSSNRRCALQEYLRQLVRIPFLRRESTTLKAFIDFQFNVSSDYYDDYQQNSSFSKNDFFENIRQEYDETERANNSTSYLQQEINVGDTVFTTTALNSQRTTTENITTVVEDVSNDNNNSSNGYYINSPVRDHSDSVSSEDSEFDYNARVVNTPLDYNSNDSDDEEGDDEDASVNNDHHAFNESNRNNNSSSNGSEHEHDKSASETLVEVVDSNSAQTQSGTKDEHVDNEIDSNAEVTTATAATDCNGASML